jgi:hypothetical protein
MAYRHRLRDRTPGHGWPGWAIRSPYRHAMDGIDSRRSTTMPYRHRLLARTPGHGWPGRTIRNPYRRAMDGSDNCRSTDDGLSPSAARPNARPRVRRRRLRGTASRLRRTHRALRGAGPAGPDDPKPISSRHGWNRLPRPCRAEHSSAAGQTLHRYAPGAPLEWHRRSKAGAPRRTLCRLRRDASGAALRSTRAMPCCSVGATPGRRLA